MTIEQAQGFLIGGKWLAFVAAVIAVLGPIGVTPQDLQGTANVLSALLGLISWFSTHIGHRAVAGAIKAGRIK